MRSLNIINSTIRSDARSFAATLTTSFLACWLLVGGAALAQDAEFEPLSEAELATLVGPIALYPDDVLAVVLPASTYPLQIVQAARFLDEREADPNVEPDPDWDDSVVALLNYPEIVRLMNDDLDWTWALGEAVLDDQTGVLAAVQNFRSAALNAGNLATDDRQVVSEDDGVIAIAPADPEVVYIPYYEPERVVVYQPYPVYHYYPTAYPLYYYPYPYGYRFRTGFFWGVTSWFSIGWHSHYLHVYHHSYATHPYYHRTYYTPYYRRSGVYLTVNVNNYNNVWRPRYRRGARPYDGIRARVDGRGTRSYDGRRYRYTSGAGTGGRTLTRSTEGGGLADRSRITNGRPLQRSQPNQRNAPRADTHTSRNTLDRRSNAGNTTTRQNRANGSAEQRGARPNGQRANEQRANGQRAITPGAAGNSRLTTRRQNTDPRAMSRRDSSARPVNPSAVRRTPSENRAATQNRAPATAQQRATPQARVAPQRQAMGRVAPQQRLAPPRQTAPRNAAPRAAAPRSGAPRAVAPQRSAPRASAPRQSSAPRGSAPPPRAQARQSRPAARQAAPRAGRESSGRQQQRRAGR